LSNVTADEVRFIGGYSSSDFSDALINSAAFIGAGDAWINKIISDNGSTSFASFAGAHADEGALAKAAECWYIAMLLALSPPSDDFSTGGVSSKSNAETRRKIAQDCFDKAKDMLSTAGLKVDNFTFGFTGGYQYSETGHDDSNVDFGTASDGQDYPFNAFTMET
jgi:hypothetical protein